MTPSLRPRPVGQIGARCHPRGNPRMEETSLPQFRCMHYIPLKLQNFPRPAGFRSCFVADERGRTIVLSPLLPASPPRSPPSLPSSHRLIIPPNPPSSFPPLFSVLSSLIFAYHTSHQVSIGRRSAGRVRSSLGGRENPSCLFSRHYSGGRSYFYFYERAP